MMLGGTEIFYRSCNSSSVVVDGRFDSGRTSSLSLDILED